MSSYRGDLSPSDRADIESWRDHSCRFCRGTGFVSIRGAGNPMSVEPCGCDEPDEDAPTPSEETR